MSQTNTIMPLLQYHLLWPPCDKWHPPISPAMPLPRRPSLETGTREMPSQYWSYQCHCLLYFSLTPVWCCQQLLFHPWQPSASLENIWFCSTSPPALQRLPQSWDDQHFCFGWFKTYLCTTSSVATSDSGGPLCCLLFFSQFICTEQQPCRHLYLYLF